jgi:DNA-binding NarL/FixJ family response regulator
LAGKGAFLIVEDDAAIARAIGRLLSKSRPTHHVSTVEEAKKALKGAKGWTGLVVDIGLPDGSGLDVVSVAREKWPTVPALVLTGSTQAADINRSFMLRADFLVKPGTSEEIAAFVRKAIARESIDNARIVEAVDEIAVEVGLTDRERDLLMLVAGDIKRADLAEALGVKENTAKSHVNALMKKTGAGSFDELARSVLRRALQGGSATRE